MVTQRYPAAGRQPRAILARFFILLVAPFVMTALAGPGDQLMVELEREFRPEWHR